MGDLAFCRTAPFLMGLEVVKGAGLMDGLAAIRRAGRIFFSWRILFLVSVNFDEEDANSVWLDDAKEPGKYDVPSSSTFPDGFLDTDGTESAGGRVVVSEFESFVGNELARLAVRFIGAPGAKLFAFARV